MRPEQLIDLGQGFIFLRCDPSRGLLAPAVLQGLEIISDLAVGNPQVAGDLPLPEAAVPHPPYFGEAGFVLGIGFGLL